MNIAYSLKFSLKLVQAPKIQLTSENTDTNMLVQVKSTIIVLYSHNTNIQMQGTTETLTTFFSSGTKRLLTS